MAHLTTSGIPHSAAMDLFKRIQNEVMKPGVGLEEALGDVPRLAQRIWTTDQTLQGDDVTPTASKEFCSILNSAIREDSRPVLEQAMPIIWAINTLCIVRGVRDESKLKFPVGGKCFRGSGMPPAFLPFFSVGRTYRVPGFLATSFKKEVAQHFLVQAFEQRMPPVLWEIRMDPRGATNNMFRCKQVNLVISSKFAGEEEYLFAPYSVFTVESVYISPKQTYTDPHIIVIRASLDNRLEPEDLPLAPWY